jgi:hypothetical protein
MAWKNMIRKTKIRQPPRFEPASHSPREQHHLPTSSIKPETKSYKNREQTYIYEGVGSPLL